MAARKTTNAPAPAGADYPLRRFALIESVGDNGERRPAQPPFAAEDPETAYGTFCFGDERSAQRAWATYMKEGCSRFLDGAGRIEDVGHVQIFEAYIHDDGALTLIEEDGINEDEIERDRIYSAWGMTPPGNGPKP